MSLHRNILMLFGSDGMLQKQFFMKGTDKGVDEWMLPHMLLWGSIAAAATIWGFYWLSFPVVSDVVHACVDTSWRLALTLTGSVCGIVYSLEKIRSAQKARLWPLILGTIVLFWITATLLGFDWGRTKGFFIIFVLLTTLYFAYRRVPEHHRCTAQRKEELKRMTLYANTVTLIRQLARECKIDGRGRCVGIIGRWGIGKSHLMDYVTDALSTTVKNIVFEKADSIYKGPFRIKTVDMWHCRNVEDAWISIRNALIAGVSGEALSSTLAGQNIFSHLGRLLHLPLTPLLTNISDFVFIDSNDSSDEVARLNARMRRGEDKKPLLLVLDNMDRCNIEVLMSCFPLMEKLKLIEGLIVVCVLSKEDLFLQHCGHGISVPYLQGYLDKIMDYEVELPLPDEGTMCEYFLNETERLNGGSSRNPLLCTLAKEAVFKFDTPRQACRVASTLSSFEYLYLRRFTMDCVDVCLRERVVLAFALLEIMYGDFYSKLLAEFPGIHKYLRDFPDELLNNERKISKSGKKGKIPLKYSEWETLLRHERLLCSTLIYLKKECSRDEALITYAVRKEYLVLNEMTHHEKKMLSGVCLNRNASVWTCVNEYYKGKSLSLNIREYYLELLAYVLEELRQDSPTQDLLKKIWKEAKEDVVKDPATQLPLFYILMYFLRKTTDDTLKTQLRSYRDEFLNAVSPETLEELCCNLAKAFNCDADIHLDSSVGMKFIKKLNDEKAFAQATDDDIAIFGRYCAQVLEMLCTQEVRDVKLLRILECDRAGMLQAAAENTRKGWLLLCGTKEVTIDFDGKTMVNLWLKNFEYLTIECRFCPIDLACLWNNCIKEVVKLSFFSNAREYLFRVLYGKIEAFLADCEDDTHAEGLKSVLETLDTLKKDEYIL